MATGADLRRATVSGPLPGDTGWLTLSDDELLFQIQSLPPAHEHDQQLLGVVRSERHFFVRQEAAKRIVDPELLKTFASDRHIGQILARQMRRDSDVEYLQQLLRDSRHLEVRNAAAAQLRVLQERLRQKA